MKYIFRFESIVAGLIYLIAVTSVNAESSNMQLQLMESSKLLSQLRADNDSAVDSISQTGVPSAESPSIQNADDLRSGDNVILSSTIADTEASMVEQYFKILTGKNLQVYGSNEFAQSQDGNLLFFNTFGNKYRLAPGDVLRINLRGFVEFDGNNKVTRDGKIILSGLPPIDVAGITTDELETKILDLLRLGDASASAFVSLDTGRLVTIQVSGGVKNPRTIAVPAYTPLSRVLAFVGGVSDAGSLRQISLILNGAVTQEIDFYDFLQNPLGGADPLVSDSARIFVGAIGSTVAVSGFVPKPGIFELAPGENTVGVNTLLKLSATNLLPPGGVLEVLYFDKDGMSRSRPTALDEKINSGEALNVRFVNTRNTNSISVRGAVVAPYELSATDPKTVWEVLKGGSVFARNAELSFAIIYGPKTEPYLIDVNDALAYEGPQSGINPSPSIINIEPNSTIYILSQEEYKNLIMSDGKQLKKIDKNQSTNLRNQNVNTQSPSFGAIKKFNPDQEAALNSLLIAKKVNIYLDGKLNVVLAPNTRAIGELKLASLATGFDVYPLYIGFNRYDETTRGWNYLQLKAADLFNENRNVIFKKNDHLNFYSTKFINQLGSEIASKEDVLELGETVNLTDGEFQTSIEDAFSATDQGINTLLKSARNIFGAVDRPGAYPIAGSATLSEILSVAGGTVDGADLSEIKIINYKAENGRLLAGTNLKVNLLDKNPALIALNGQYTVMVPFLVNDAASGTISVSGEVLQPGDYIFSRAETLQEVIKKAGGLSKTAYPLGVILSREAVREQQREANNLLASEVEASVLQLAQSDVAGVKNQVLAILGFAERLRDQEVMGRLTVNVLVSDPSAPVFLEDGDKVYVPKRPSYVSVIGSVQKETMASYSSNKTFADYIASAGGLNSGADKKSIYVLLPNGESVRGTNDVLIPPGAVVVVPPKTDKLSILGLTDIISRVMGNIATSVLAINNVN